MPARAEKKGEPDLPRENAAQQQVVDGFRMLAAEGARGTGPKAMTEEPFRGPAPVLKCKPQKETEFIRGLHFPQLFSSWQSRLSHEKSLISRTAGVLA
jgi:hypothetical protein